MSNVFRSLTLIVALAGLASAGELRPIERRLPPPGNELPAADSAALRASLERLHGQLAKLQHPLLADVEVYAKAVDLALRHGEFYAANDRQVARDVLAEGEKRVAELAAGQTPWTTQRGLVVRGFRSAIDGSAQPYGLVIPESLDLSKPVPLYVWLHGRGDKETDLHFVWKRRKQPGQVVPADAIVLHAFGRHCLGFKSAGEIDVLEAVDHARSQLPIDPDRIALLGFSMGGAGAWHLGAHYTDRWCVVSPGAGFAETARYQKLAPAAFPPPYEQTLWGAYDVPGYVRNLFNVPVFAYSGAIDPQIQAARVMEEAFAAHDRKLTHLIGPDTAHQYHKETLADLLQRVATAVARGRDRQPRSVSLQTRTLRYSRQAWVEARGLERHWQDARIDAEIVDDTLRVATANVSHLRLSPPAGLAVRSVALDGHRLPATVPLEFVRRDGAWQAAVDADRAGLRKRPGQQGPIDDVFLEPFLVVTPSGESAHPAVQAWVEFELAHFLDRWRAVFRGEARVKRDVDVTDADLRTQHVVLWGDAASNRLIARVLSATNKPPVTWSGETLAIGTQRFGAAAHVPLLVYPNPLSPSKYVVFNSGPTFREGHDRTNSLQNPKLPDWAVIDLSQPPSDLAPGRVASAGFFDERWQVANDKAAP